MSSTHDHGTHDHGTHDHGTHDHGTHEPGTGLPQVPEGPDAWDERYAAADRVWSGNPNAALVAEVTGLPAGRVLDVGCGEGADAVWLAGLGWDVTALDVSRVALERAAAHAEAAGVRVHWLLSGLVEAAQGGFDTAPGGFDLVSAQYPALRRTPGQDAEHALLGAVADGGLLLFVHHAGMDAEHGRAQGFDPDDYVQPADMADLLRSEGTGWKVEVDEKRARDIRGGSGAHHTHDLVVRARRAPA